MEEIRTTDLLVTLREKGKVLLPMNLLIRASSYDTVRTPTFLTLHQIKAVKREMKGRIMVRITKTPGEDDGYRLNPDSSSGIYTTLVNDEKLSKYHPKKSPINLSIIHTSSSYPLHKKEQTTKLSLQVLKCQTEKI